MAKNILQEAVAEAQTVRKAAIQQAYRELEENLTPSIKEALAHKLSEEFVFEEDEEELQEEVNSGFKPVTPKKQIEEADEEVAKEPDGDEEGGEAEGNHEEPDGDEPEKPEENEPDGDEEGGEAEGNHEEPDGDEPVEEISDETEISDLTLGQLKDVITDILSTAFPQTAPEGDLGADMEPGDVEGQGEEEPLPATAEPDSTNALTGTEEEDDDTEISLDEILKELEDEESSRKVVTHSQDKEQCPTCKESKEIDEVKKELQEAQHMIEVLNSTLSELNLSNAKLLYYSRILNSNSLSESQTAKVINRLDEAKTVKEVKSTYKVISKNLKNRNTNVLREHKNLASKSAGKSTAPVMPVDETVRRFQQLAGIID